MLNSRRTQCLEAINALCKNDPVSIGSCLCLQFSEEVAEGVVSIRVHLENTHFPEPLPVWLSFGMIDYTYRHGQSSSSSNGHYIIDSAGSAILNTVHHEMLVMEMHSFIDKVISQWSFKKFNKFMFFRAGALQ